ncbi:hypothetical protein OESDEN_02171 [Oesophagostomum dentatum]|uniref:VWFA domain-containing protein n=1 Tax=Oesophagostomum dentatum TaxID=61180 RepID=A0A0B1TR16_OESDE|nr:hypothetical protein OESDEN_02171 [Oesophagostomum dentatum]
MIMAFKILISIIGVEPTDFFSLVTSRTRGGSSKSNVQCLVVADMSNFGNDTLKYEQEAKLINDVGAGFFSKTRNSSIGIVAYGTVPMLPLIRAVNAMKDNNRDFAKEVAFQTRSYYSTVLATTEKLVFFSNDLCRKI